MYDQEAKRCEWLTKDELYIKYHDEEWGRPEFDSYRLFEILCLEGQQAGLAWITILKKREDYQKLFFNFNPHQISKLTQQDVAQLLTMPSIVRHKGKIESIIHNSNCLIKMEQDGEDFSKFIWSFVNHKPIVNSWKSNKEIPACTPTSLAMSKALKRKGFKYVGETICYAFMQACGLVNDHLTNCISYHINDIK